MRNRRNNKTTRTKPELVPRDSQTKYYDAPRVTACQFINYGLWEDKPMNKAHENLLKCREERHRNYGGQAENGNARGNVLPNEDSSTEITLSPKHGISISTGTSVPFSGTAIHTSDVPDHQDHVPQHAQQASRASALSVTPDQTLAPRGQSPDGHTEQGSFILQCSWNLGPTSVIALIVIATVLLLLPR